MKPEQIQALASWLAEQAGRLAYGEVQIVLKVHDNRIVRLEKDVRILEQPQPSKAGDHEKQR